MNVKELLKKAGLTEEQLDEIESGFTALIEEKVDYKVQEEKLRLEKLSEQYVAEAVAEKTEEIKNTLEEATEQWKQEKEAEYVDKLDKFLEHEISENISDEALEKIAINETLEPVVNGIKKVFEENGLELNTDGEVQVKKLKEEIDTLKGENSDLINKNMESADRAEKAAILLRITEATENLTVEQKTRVKEMFEGKDFDTVHAKIDGFVDMIIEESTEKANDKDKHDDLHEETTDDQDGLETLKEENGEEDTLIDQAGSWWD